MNLVDQIKELVSVRTYLAKVRKKIFLSVDPFIWIIHLLLY